MLSGAGTNLVEPTSWLLLSWAVTSSSTRSFSSPKRLVGLGWPVGGRSVRSPHTSASPLVMGPRSKLRVISPPQGSGCAKLRASCSGPWLCVIGSNSRQRFISSSPIDRDMGSMPNDRDICSAPRLSDIGSTCPLGPLPANCDRIAGSMLCVIRLGVSGVRRSPPYSVFDSST